VAGLTAHALRAGYRGPLSLEVFNDVFRQSPAVRTAVDARRSLTALEEATAGRMSTPGSAAAGTRPSVVTLTPPPAPVVPSGFAFAELSVGQPAELDDLLTALGFTRTGRHRSKAVALWEQGDARLLVNADRGSETTKLCTIGLESDDPEASVDRAVAGPDGTVRLALNVQPAAYDGAAPGPLQHVAFATDDILAAAAAMRRAGVPLLPVPENYYDDLEARHRLDPGLAGDLRRLGVLYDRDGDGEFLQLFTATVGELFFEVVQRVGGYDGYGARNAPFRLAAQHRRAAAPARR
jgi:4-hydroxyphenylpyruvate dioxygenase